MADFQRIPVIDLGAAGASAEIGRACEATGFFYVTGHGVPDTVVDGVFAAARWFANPDYDAVAVPLDGDRSRALACGPHVEAAYRAAWPLAQGVGR